MASTTYTTDGGKINTAPINGKTFTLEELQGIVGGYIEIITLPDGNLLIVDEEGKNKNKRRNKLATEIWYRAFPPEIYEHIGGDYIAGDCLITSPETMN